MSDYLMSDVGDVIYIVHHKIETSKIIKLFSFFGGRQPLWGKGVMSLIITISMPDCDKDRIAPSRPEPGPFTKTSTLFKPASKATFAASLAAIWAA